MNILEMPAQPSFSSSRFALLSQTREFKSLFDGSVQNEELPGARWGANYTLPVMTREQAASWQVFGVRLRGSAGRFYGFDPDYAILGPQGSPLGNPLVDGIEQAGTSLNADGWLASTRIFEIGDQFAFDTPVGRELKMIVEPIDSDENGEATLVFEPPIRNSPVDDVVIITDRPSCVMMLESDAFGWDTDELMLYQFSVNAVEALR